MLTNLTLKLNVPRYVKGKYIYIYFLVCGLFIVRVFKAGHGTSCFLSGILEDETVPGKDGFRDISAHRLGASPDAETPPPVAHHTAGLGSILELFRWFL